MNVVFLGSNYNPISIHCLQGLLSSGTVAVLVGVDNQARGGFAKMFLTGARRYGPVSFSFRIAGHILDRLIRKIPFVARRKGPGSVKEICKTKGIECVDITDVNGQDTIERFRQFRPDILAVANFSQILRKEVLELAPGGCINFHPSLLPAYRGPVPLYWMKKNGETRGGGTIHFLSEELDSGDIILQRSFSMSPRDSDTSLLTRSAELGATLMAEAVRMFEKGDVPRVQQNETLASYYPFPKGKRTETKR